MTAPEATAAPAAPSLVQLDAAAMTAAGTALRVELARARRLLAVVVTGQLDRPLNRDLEGLKRHLVAYVRSLAAAVEALDDARRLADVVATHGDPLRDQVIAQVKSVGGALRALLTDLGVPASVRPVK